MAHAFICKVHPAIGVARVGNAPGAEYFVGPEVPGAPPNPGNGASPLKTFKNAAGQVRPQAARFRVWEYALQLDGTYKATREITGAEADLRWEVHLANTKAAFHRFDGAKGETAPAAPLRNAARPRGELAIDPLPRKILGSDPGPVAFTPGTSASPGAEKWPVYPAAHHLAGTRVIDYLGELRTDSRGRLLVIGGRGVARSDRSTPGAAAGAPPVEPGLADYANNDGWFDDVADGWVKVDVSYKKGKEPDGKAKKPGEVLPAWVLVGPPDFAPGVRPVVSLYDLLVDVAARGKDIAAHFPYFDRRSWDFLVKLNAELKGKPAAGAVLAAFEPHYERDLEPILRAALEVGYVYDLHGAHGSVGGPISARTAAKAARLKDRSPAAKADRTGVLGWLREPPGAAHPHKSVGNMPKLLDDANAPGLHVPPTQFAMFGRWAEGKFRSAAVARPKTPRPADLDRAAAEAAIGGAFYPGIEVGWQVRHPELFLEPFRIDVAATSRHRGDSGVPIGPGHFSRQMALPWQADFTACAKDAGQGNYGWWPSQRPDDVFASPGDVATATYAVWARTSAGLAFKYDDMRAAWWKLGFVTTDKGSGEQVQTERNAGPIP